MTGTGIVPPDAFTLAAGDEIRITIEPVGTLDELWSSLSDDRSPQTRVGCAH